MNGDKLNIVMGGPECMDKEEELNIKYFRSSMISVAILKFSMIQFTFILFFQNFNSEFKKKMGKAKSQTDYNFENANQFVFFVCFSSIK